MNLINFMNFKYEWPILFTLALNSLNLVNTIQTDGVFTLLNDSVHWEVYFAPWAFNPIKGLTAVGKPGGIIFTPSESPSIVIRGIPRSINFADYKEDNRTRRAKPRIRARVRARAYRACVKRHHLCIPWLNRFCFRLSFPGFPVD